MKVEVDLSSEILVTIFQTTRSHRQENRILLESMRTSNLIIIEILILFQLRNIIMLAMPKTISSMPPNPNNNERLRGFPLTALFRLSGVMPHVSHIGSYNVLYCYGRLFWLHYSGIQKLRVIRTHRHLDRHTHRKQEYLINFFFKIRKIG